MEERRVDLQGQRHDFGSAALGLGRQAVGVLQRGLGEIGEEESRLQYIVCSRRSRRSRQRRAGSGRHDRAARSAIDDDDDDSLRLDRRLRCAAGALSNLAPVVPLPLVSPACAVPASPGISKPALPPRADAPQSALSPSESASESREQAGSWKRKAAELWGAPTQSRGLQAGQHPLDQTFTAAEQQALDQAFAAAKQ